MPVRRLLGMQGFDPQAIILATLFASLVLFVTDALRYDAVAVLVVLVLAATGVLTPQEAFSGFASPAVVLVASMYAFAVAVSRSGITETIGARLLSGETITERRLAFRVVLVAGLLSSVLSNAAVVATLIPMLGSVSRQTRVPLARLLMPLAFGSLLGGMLTVIGTSKNIAVNGVIEQNGGVPFELFDFTLYGLILLAVGALYFLGPGRALLPEGRVVQTTLSEHYQVPKFVTEVLVEPASNLINRAVADIKIFDRYGISLLGLVRAEGDSVMAPGPYNRIRSDDVLILQGEPDAIVEMRKDLGLRARDTAAVGDVNLVADDVNLLEAVVPAYSSLVGQSLAEADFFASTGLNVLAISKQGDVLPTQIAEAPLEVGDTLLIQGHARDVERVKESRSLIVMGEYRPQNVTRNAIVTVALLIGTLLLAATTNIHLSVAALGGALGLVLLRCLRADDVRQGMDWSVLILIGGMLALGRAFDKHGLGTSIADWIHGVGGALEDPRLLMAVLFLATLLLTQLINHVAAAVIMTPVALSLAMQMGVNDRAFLMAVLTGAELAFMSPVAHQANAMVMGPGDYRYRDFLRAGTPLTIILAATAMVILPLFWPFD